MRIHFLQHAACDGPGNMASILTQKGHELQVTRLYQKKALPPLGDMDWLIILGGEMGIHDEKDHPWLKQEKALIREAIRSGMPVLGICLGAQLIAHVLGGRVCKNLHPEIGWFPVTRSDQICKTILKDAIPPIFEAFHWHNDTFEIPQGAQKLGSSPACSNQGFIKDNRIVALQFHPEVRLDDARAFFEAVGPGPERAMYVQTKEDILSRPEQFNANACFMASLLETLETSFSSRHTVNMVALG